MNFIVFGDIIIVNIRRPRGYARRIYDVEFMNACHRLIT